MKKLLILSFILFHFFSTVKAQQTQVKGMVVDSSANNKLSNASVSILQAKDSILVTFTRTNSNGEFNFKNLSAGNYLILVTYPDYADFMNPFSLDNQENKNLGKIEMILKTRLLQEVIVKGEAVQVRMKGDTTEFDAKTFKVQPNAKVEDLLKQLPGITVDKDGKITAQGQTVNRVLVDGEEFFGDDPTLVTKNIRSDMVDKVQLYDDKSENTKFTGIDDGVKNKTINLKLKEDKKKGYFGKVDVGQGDQSYYSTQGLFNLFNKSSKLSVYSTLGNTKKTGLDWQTAQKYGLLNNNIEIGDNGGIMINFNNDSFAGNQFYGQGVPKIVNTGVHFDTKWLENKHTLGVDLKYGKLDNLGFRNSIFQNSLPTAQLKNNSNLNFDNTLNQKKGVLTYNFNIDSTSNIKIGFDLTSRNNNNANNTISTGYKDDLTLINSGTKNFNESNNNLNQNFTLFYGKKFKKIGRTLTFRFNQSHFNTTSDGLLQSVNKYYNPNNGSLDSTNFINQLKNNNTSSDSYKTSLTYTEKLGELFAITGNYDYASANSNSDLKSFNADGNGNYTIADPLYSNNLEYKINTNQFGLTFNYKKDKTTINFGTIVANSNLKQNNLLTNTLYNINYTNYIPSVSYQYDFSKQSRLTARYDGGTSQPTINQLQPILNNQDPFNITVGNPDLKPSFRNNLNFNYVFFKPLSGLSLYAGGAFSYTNNAIVNNRTTDEAGNSILKFVNLGDKKPTNFYFYINYSKKIGKSPIRYSVNLNGDGGTFYNIVNNELSKVKSQESSIYLGLSSYEKKYSFRLGAEIGYIINNSALQPLQNSNGAVLRIPGTISYNFPGKVTLNLDFQYQFQNKTTVFNTNFEQFNINSSIEKKFFKDENLKFVLSSNDLLNQNVGFERNISGTTLNQTNYNTIKRYFMLSLVWDFSKFGKLKD